MENKISVYSRAYTEVLTILNTLSEDEYKKIPAEIIEHYKKHCDSSYNYDFQPEKSLNEQPILQETKSIIVLLFRDYFASDRQKEKLKIILNQNEQAKEEKKCEKYNKENIFKNNKIEIEKNNNKDVSIIEYKENIITKIFRKIKNIRSKNK